MTHGAGFCSRSKAAAADARHARDLGLQLPASSATGGTAAAEARRLADDERPTPQPPRRPRSERPTKPTLSEWSAHPRVVDPPAHHAAAMQM